MQPHSWAGCALPLRLPRPPLCSRGDCTIGATLGSRPKVCRRCARCSVQGGVYQRPGHAFAGGRGPRSRRRPRAALTRTRTSRRPGRARVVFRHTALFQLSTAAKYGARRSSIALSTCQLKAPHSKCVDGRHDTFCSVPISVDCIGKIARTCHSVPFNRRPWSRVGDHFGDHFVHWRFATDCPPLSAILDKTWDDRSLAQKPSLS